MAVILFIVSVASYPASPFLFAYPDGLSYDIGSDNQSGKLGKWSAGVSYKLGVCYTGRDLVGESSDPYDPFKWLYLLNAVNLGIIYHIAPHNAIGLDFGYGWTALRSRHLQCFSIGVVKQLGLHYFGEIELIHGQHKMVEYKYNYDDPVVVDSAQVTRKCFGAGFLYSFVWGKVSSRGITISPIISLRLALAREYENDAPEEWNRHTRITINYSGIYLGLKLNWGG